MLEDFIRSLSNRELRTLVARLEEMLHDCDDHMAGWADNADTPVDELERMNAA